jgi:histidinol-phosphate aminotransferase
MDKIYRDAIDNLKPYVPGKPISEVQREFCIKDVIKLASNENPLGASPKAVHAIRKAAEEVYYYPEGSCFELKKELARKLEAAPENLIFGNGSDELLLMISQAFFNPGDEIIQADPNLTFVEYNTVTAIAGAVPVFVDLKDYCFDLMAMAEKINEKTKLIFIANPNNPTGTIVTKAEVEEFLKKVPENVLVVFDEAYYEYVERADYPEVILNVKEGKNVIILRTFSKIYGLAGLRIGYGIANKDIISILEKVKQPFNVNSIAQAGALAALSDLRHIEQSRKTNSEGKSFLYDSLEAMGLEFVSSQANFILIDLKKNAKEAAGDMLKEGIIVRPIGGPNFIRVTIGTAVQNEKFIKTLKKVLGGK